MKMIQSILLATTLLSSLIGFILNFYYLVTYCSRMDQWKYFTMPIFMVPKNTLTDSERKGAKATSLCVLTAIGSFLILIVVNVLFGAKFR